MCSFSHNDTNPCSVYTRTAYLRTVKKVCDPPIVTLRPKRLSDVWFQHVSQKRLDAIVPPTYKDLLYTRAMTMGVPAAETYVAERTVLEDSYRVALGIDNDVLSFSYATVVGFHEMDDTRQYPGFTYFFQLTHEQVSQTLFGLVTGDVQLSIPTERGIHGLERCLMQWNRYSGLFRTTDDNDIGVIDPRIEVVISYPVRPIAFVTQQEDR